MLKKPFPSTTTVLTQLRYGAVLTTYRQGSTAQKLLAVLPATFLVSKIQCLATIIESTQLRCGIQLPDTPVLSTQAKCGTPRHLTITGSTPLSSGIQLQKIIALGQNQIRVSQC
jgi:hypothetical protein